MSTSLRVGVDLDDVLYPMALAMHDVCARAGVTNGVKSYKSWKMYDDYGITFDQWHEALRPAIADGSVYAGEPYVDAVDAMKFLHYYGHTIHIVTARGNGIFAGKTKAYTVEWLDKWGFPYDSLTFSAAKSIVKTDIFIDDALHNYVELKQAGIDAYLINRPHNQPDRGEQRVNHLHEFVTIARRKGEQLLPKEVLA